MNKSYFTALLSFTCFIQMQFQTHAAEKKLNIVFILADDLGWGELGCYGQKKIPTPNIDKLASQGMRFTRHYSGAPVCAPSRCVLMTGKHMGNAEIRGNIQAKLKFPEFNEGQYPLTAEAITFPMLFQKAGYATGAMGKWGLGPVGSTGEPNRKGFDLFYGYNCQAVAHSYFPPFLWRNSEKEVINKTPIPGHKPKPEGDITIEASQGENYAPKLMVAEAEKFIADNKNKPFFLFLPFIEPHVGLQPPPDAVEKFPKEWDEKVYRGGNGYSPHPRPRAAYAAMIATLDSHVGKVLKSLDDAGIADHTLVVFTSDNGATHPVAKEPGFHAGGADPAFFNGTANLRGYKGDVYEGGIRVPMIARLPEKIAANSVNDSPGYFADWFPTLCDAVGIAKPDGVNLDGESLWSTMQDGKLKEHKQPMIWVFPEYTGQVAVQMGDLKAVRRGLKTKKIGDWEVYNIVNDRSEKNNIANEHKEFIEKVKTVLKANVKENKNFPVPIPD